jgi:hypothetical protein
VISPQLGCFQRLDLNPIQGEYFQHILGISSLVETLGCMMGENHRHIAFSAIPSSLDSIIGVRFPSAVAHYAKKVRELSL